MFRIEIETDNAAFTDEDSGGPQPGPELARILRELAETVEEGVPDLISPRRIRDINGNPVGSWYVD